MKKSVRTITGNAMLEFKSKLVQEFDYHSVDLTGHEPKTFVFDEKIYQKDLERILKRFGNKIQPETAQPGDLVVVDLNGSSERYQKKNLSLIIGKHMASEALEKAICGLSEGTHTLMLDDEPAEICIQSITRTVLPSLEDETVSSWGMEGIGSVKDLRKYLVDKQLDAFFIESDEGEECTAQISMQLNNTVVIEMNPEEEILLRQEIKSKTDTRVTDEEEEFDVASFMETIIRSSFKLALLGQEELRKEGKLYDCSKYDEYIDRWMQSDPSCTREEMISEHPLFSYMMDEYAGYYIELLDKYVLDFYKKVINV